MTRTRGEQQIGRLRRINASRVTEAGNLARRPARLQDKCVMCHMPKSSCPVHTQVRIIEFES